jgi:hypothetical protein
MGERGVGGSLGGYVNGGRKKEICLLTFLGTLGVSRMVRCCISIVSITIFIFMTIISILTSIYSLHKDIHLTAPVMPSQIPTLFSPCPSSIFTCTRIRMPSRTDNRSYSSRPPSLSMAQEQCPAPSEASLNSLPNFLDPSSR